MPARAGISRQQFPFRQTQPRPPETAHKARAAWAIVLDVRTGEVLAMVNEPGFNPNNRADLRSALFRNRAVTDVIEPGSTLKPFTIAAALESGKYTPDSLTLGV